MRKLDRAKVKVPDILVAKDSEGVLETAAAIAYYSKKKPKGEKIEYKVYGHATVKKAVSDLSFNKCAYCESMVLSIDDGDVEHFRPKGLITIEGFDPISPGYYWMGADWNNLFLSCKHCNQSRKQPTPDGAKKTMGKKNQFPLSDNKKRVRSHKKKITDEEPYRLLVDPALEDPLKYIEFDDQGMIFPKSNSKGKKKGEISIEVFALYRKMLVDARKMQALTVMAALKTFQDHSAELDADMPFLPPDRIAKRRAQLEEEIKKLNVYTRPDQLFSGMSLTLIKGFLKKMGITYKET